MEDLSCNAQFTSCNSQVTSYCNTQVTSYCNAQVTSYCNAQVTSYCNAQVTSFQATSYYYQVVIYVLKRYIFRKITSSVNFRKGLFLRKCPSLIDPTLLVSFDISF
jgi:hypothetical protein